MGEAHLPGPRDPPSPYEPNIRDGMVGAPEGPLRNEGLSVREPSGHTVDLRGLYRLLEGHVREDRGEPPREHGLARAGLAYHDEVVPAGGGYCDGPLHVLLALYVSEVGLCPLVPFEIVPQVGLPRLNDFIAVKELHEPGEVVHPIDLETFDKGGLSPVLGRKYQLLARGPRAHGYAKGAAHRPYAPVEGQFAEYEVVGEGLALYDILGLQERHGHGQVVQGSLFLYVRRGEVYCYTLYGEGVAGVLYGGLDPVLALIYRVVRKTHGGKGGQTPRYVDLNLHRVGVDSECGRAEDLGEHIVLLRPVGQPFFC